MNKVASIIHADRLSVGYKQGRTVRKVLRNLTFSLFKGELVCLIGPNGTGKSTLLRSIAGLLPILNGSVLLDDMPIGTLNSFALAKKISLVLSGNQNVNLRVDELVEMGRIPYTGWLGKLSPEDDNKVEEALEITGTHKFRGRNFQQLSDGEKQRVMLARALAQDTPVLLLDEPTAHLDIPGRMEMMLLQRHLAHEMGKAILLSTHDLHLALEMADRIWLLNDEGILHTGLPEELLINGCFQEAFHKEGFIFDTETGQFKVITENSGLSVKLISESGLGVGYWTKKALLRKGYDLQSDHSTATVIVEELNAQPMWVMMHKSGVNQRFDSLELLLDGLETLALQIKPL